MHAANQLDRELIGGDIAYSPAGDGRASRAASSASIRASPARSHCGAMANGSCSICRSSPPRVAMRSTARRSAIGCANIAPIMPSLNSPQRDRARASQACSDSAFSHGELWHGARRWRRAFHSCDAAKVEGRGRRANRRRQRSVKTNGHCSSLLSGREPHASSGSRQGGRTVARAFRQADRCAMRGAKQGLPTASSLYERGV